MNHPYKLAGIAALLLAVLFPLYWLTGIVDLISGGLDVIHTDIQTLDAWDLLFVIIGVLEVYVYLKLSHYFRDQLHGSFAAISFKIMALLIALFHSLVLVDVWFALSQTTSSAQEIAELTSLATLILGGLYCIATLAMCIATLSRFRALPYLLRAFCIGMLFMAVFHLTLVLTIVGYLLFPVLLVLLAIHWLTAEQYAEVV